MAGNLLNLRQVPFASNKIPGIDKE